MPEATRPRESGRLQLPARTAGPIRVQTPRPRVGAVSPSGRAQPDERRNAASRQALLHRILAEFDELPALCLTTAQGQRLFGLREDVCVRVFNQLVETARLRRDDKGVYRRTGR